ncbi:MAG: hypothetical protein HY904_19835 [Deltaproteobacteria bacterium]|nr:hypothetical protein [Deltaproteobacteria bacterium]
MLIRRRCLLLVVAGGLAGCPTPRTDSRGSISGRVTLVDRDGLNDLSRVRVDLGRGEGGVVPAEDGSFEVSDLEPDTYAVTVTYAGGLTPTATRSAYKRLETRAVVRAGSSVHLELSPQRALGAVEGDVVGVGPGAEARVELQLDDGRTLSTLTTAGHFRVDGVPVGTHQARASAPGFAVRAGSTACAPEVTVNEEDAVAPVADLGLAATRAAFAPGLGEVVRQDPVHWFLAGATVTVHVDAAYARQARHWVGVPDGGPPAPEAFAANGFALTVPADASQEHFFQFTDGCGYESTVYSLTLTHDATPPQLNLVQLNEGAAWTTEPQTRLLVLAQDLLSPDLSMRYALCDVDAADNETCDQDVNTAPWGAYRMGISTAFLPADGTKRVRVQVRDGSWHVTPAPPQSEAATITLDSLPPENVVITVGNGSGVIHAPRVAVTIQADGADRMRLGDASALTGVPWVPYQPQTEFAFSDGEGTKDLYVQLADAAGNPTAILPTSVTLVTRGSVTGRVVLEGTGNVVEVSVALVGGTAQATPAADGSFALSGVPFGLAQVSFSMTGAAAARYASVERVASVGPGAATALGNVTLPLGRGTLVGRALLVGESVHSWIGVSAADVNNAANTHGTLTSDTGSYTLALLPVGTYQLYAEKAGWGRANLGTQSVTAGAITTVPDATLVASGGGDFIINDREGFTNNPTLRLKLSHASAVEFLASEDPTFAGASPRSFQNNVDVTHPLADTTEGTRVIYVRYVTVPPNTNTATASIVFDQTPPDPLQAGVTLDLGAAFSRSLTGKVRVDVSGADALSGLARALISFTGTPTGALNVPFTRTYNDVDVPSPGTDGERTVSVWLVDRAGNTSLQAVTDAIYLDRRPPAQTQLQISATGFSQSSAVTLTLGAQDVCDTGYPGCGSSLLVDAVQVLVANRDDFVGSEWRPFGPELAWFLAPGEGLRTVYVKYRDAAGNESVRYSASVTVDSVPPSRAVLLLQEGAPVTNTQNVPVTLTADGATTYRLTLAGQTPGAFLPLPAPATFLLADTEGPQSVVADLADDAGHTVSTSASIELDRTPPAAVVIRSVGARTSSAFVDWSDSTDPAPGGGTRAVTHYRLEALQGATVKASAEFSLSDGWLESLPPYTNLTFRVTALDAAGNPSAVSPAISAMVGLQSEPLPDLTLLEVPLVSYRGFVIANLSHGSNKGPTSFDVCDARAGRCEGPLQHTQRDLQTLDGIPATSNARAISNLVVSPQGLFVFQAWQDAASAYSLHALRFDATRSNLAAVPDLPSWTYRALGPANAVSRHLTASANRQLVGVAYHEDSTTFTLHTCALARDCAAAIEWTGPVRLVNADPAWRWTGLLDPPALEFGQNHLFAAYRSNNGTQPGVAVLSCAMAEGCRTSSTPWVGAFLPVEGPVMVRLLETPGHLYVFAAREIGGITDPDALSMWRCDFTGSATRDRQCDTAAKFTGPVDLVTPSSMSSRLPGVAWWAGVLHLAVRDWIKGDVYYARCNEQAADCMDPLSWAMDSVPVESVGNVNGGGAPLALVGGNPIILASRTAADSTILQSATPAPLQRALLPDVVNGGLVARWTSAAAGSVDGYSIAYSTVGPLAPFDQSLAVAGGAVETAQVSNVNGVPHSGTLVAAAGLDRSVAFPTFTVKGAGSVVLNTLSRGAYEYSANSNCHVVAYAGPGDTVHASACAKSSGCNQASNWNDVEIEPVRSAGNANVNSVTAAANATHLYVAWAHEGPGEVKVERRTLSSGCALGTTGTAVTVYLAPPSPSRQPEYLSIAATSSRVFLAFDAHWQSFTTSGSTDMQYRVCATSTLCDAAADFTTLTWPHGYGGGSLALTSTALYWAMLLGDNTTAQTGIQVWRCALSSGCDATTDWTAGAWMYPPAAGLSGQIVGRMRLQVDSAGALAFTWLRRQAALCSEPAAGTLCLGAEDWKQVWFNGSVAFEDTSTPSAAVLGTANGDLVMVAGGNGRIDLGRCGGRCWEPDNWLGGSATISQYTNLKAGAGVVAANGEVTLVYEHLNDLRFVTGLSLDYLVP